MHHTKLTQTEPELLKRWENEGIANKGIVKKLSSPMLIILRE